jgi:hypothetical protein
MTAQRLFTTADDGVEARRLSTVLDSIAFFILF